MGDFHIKKIILPSGKAVEIVYFDAEGQRDEIVDRTVRDGFAAPGGTRLPVHDLCTCPQCTGRLVYPIDWREAPGDGWELELRCPDCEWRTRAPFDQDVVERFDEALNGATDDLIETLERVSRENMSEEIDRFVQALASDAILPFDF